MSYSLIIKFVFFIKLTFDCARYVDFFNRKANKNVLNKSNKLIVSSTTLAYLGDLFAAIESLNFTRAQFQRSFVNLVYINSIISLVKPLELFSQSHIHVKFPIRYYQAYYDYYTSQLLTTGSSRRIATTSDYLKNAYRLTREQNCAYSVIDMFSVVDSREQIELQRLVLNKRRHTSERKKLMTKQMLDNLLVVVLDLIERQDWIDTATRHLIRQQVENIKFKLMFADVVLNNHTTNISASSSSSSSTTTPTSSSSRLRRYGHINNHFIENFFALKKILHGNDFDLLNARQAERVRHPNYVFDIFLTNMMYLKEYNMLIVPAGVLVEPIFNMDNPLYLSYATVGAYMAHEIWHLIDDVLLSSASRLNYTRHLECLRHGYANYVSEHYSMRVDGYASLSEQVADHFGILVALKAYADLSSRANDKIIADRDDNATLMGLPGLDFSQEQLMMIRYTQGFCRKVHLTSVEQFEQFHAIHEYRGGQVSLLVSFDNVFKCNKTRVNTTSSKQFDQQNQPRTCDIFQNVF